MAFNEACSLWIKQRVQEEIDRQTETGLSHREMGRQIASEIEKIFEAEVNPETIRKRIDRIASGTNVPNTDEDENTENKQEIEKIEKPKHGGARQGAGKKRKETLDESVQNPEQNGVLPRNPQQVVDRIVGLRKDLSDQFAILKKLAQTKALTSDRPFREITNQVQLLVNEAAEDLGIYIIAPEDPARKSA